MTAERVIGFAGAMPWHLPDDLKFFKRTTLGHPIVMGRHTYDSIGKPLPGRRNIVLTRDRNWKAAGVEVIHAPDELWSLAELAGDVFIIGGAQIYQAYLPTIDAIYITHVHASPAGDTWFPPFEHAFAEAEVLESHSEFTIRRWQRQSR